MFDCLPKNVKINIKCTLCFEKKIFRQNIKSGDKKSQNAIKYGILAIKYNTNK